MYMSVCVCVFRNIPQRKGTVRVSNNSKNLLCISSHKRPCKTMCKIISVCLIMIYALNLNPIYDTVYLSKITLNTK